MTNGREIFAARYLNEHLKLREALKDQPLPIVRCLIGQEIPVRIFSKFKTKLVSFDINE